MPRFTGFSKTLIPGPRTIPFAGPFFNLMRFFDDPVGRVMALSRKYGDIAALSAGDPAVVCAFGAERNREVIGNASVFQHNSDLPLKAPPGSALERTTVSIVFVNGEAHRRRRRLMQPAFSRASIDGHAADITAVTDAALRSWPVGQAADLSLLLRRLTTSITLRCLLGLDPGTVAEELGGMMTRMLGLLTSPLTIALPFAVPGTPFNEAVGLSERLEVGLRRLIEEKRSQPAEQPDTLARLIRAHDEDGSTFTDLELVSELNTLFAAGYETSAQTLTWTLFLLAHHPKLVGDLLDEIESVVGDGPPTVEHVPRLALVDRVLKESMRILPATPILFMRVCAAEVPLGRYTLPRDANVVLSPFVTHRDPDRYPEPARFRPERWETIEPSPYEYLPFGAGPRMCLGAGFAQLTLRLVLPMILRRYRLSLAHGARVSLKVSGISVGPRYGMPVLIAPQDRSLQKPTGLRGGIRSLIDLP